MSNLQSSERNADHFTTKFQKGDKLHLICKDKNTNNITSYSLEKEKEKNEPIHDKNFDTHADDYNFAVWQEEPKQYFGGLHLTDLIKL